MTILIIFIIIHYTMNVVNTFIIFVCLFISTYSNLKYRIFFFINLIFLKEVPPRATLTLFLYRQLHHKTHPPTNPIVSAIMADAK